MKFLIQRKLSEYNIDSLTYQLLYIFDGLDEVNTTELLAYLSVINNLSIKKNTKSIIITCRSDSNYLTVIMNKTKPNIYTINNLSDKDITLFLNNKGNDSKKEKVENLLKNNNFFDFKDIFSISLLWDNIDNITDDITKIELIEMQLNNIFLRNDKVLLLNLPHPIKDNIDLILTNVAKTMISNRKLHIQINEFQKIIHTSFPLCSYMDIDFIIGVLAQLYFDSSENSNNQRIFSFIHKSYYEFYLYKFIKEEMYINPFILRDLSLFTNRDFILNILLTQELKTNIKNKNIEKVFFNGFILSYLGDSYCSGNKSSWINENNCFSLDSNTIFFRECLVDFLSNLNENQINEIINDEESLVKRTFFTSNNYMFLNKYMKKHNIDLGRIFDSKVGLLPSLNNKNEDKAQKTIYNLNNKKTKPDELLDSIIKEFSTIEAVFNYKKNQKNENIYYLITIFKYYLESHQMELSNKIIEMSINLVEIISYCILNNEGAYLLVSLKTKNNTLAKKLIDKIKESDLDNAICARILYCLLLNEKDQTSFISKYLKQKNKNHIGTWHENMEIHSFAVLACNEEFRPYNFSYTLGVDIRKLLLGFEETNSSSFITDLLEKVREFSFIKKRYFTINNSKFLGNCFSHLKFEPDDLKRFFREVDNDIIIDKFIILYQIYTNNFKLFKLITNAYSIKREYEKRDLSYYEYNAEARIMYSNMLFTFDENESLTEITNAINHCTFRPNFAKDRLFDYYLPQCLLVAYNEKWIDEKQVNAYLKRNILMLEVCESTLDNSSDMQHVKYIYELINADFIYKFGYQTEAIEPFIKTNKNVEIEEINQQLVYEIYKNDCDVDYTSIKMWQSIIDFECLKENNLEDLFNGFDVNCFPPRFDYGFSLGIHIITGLLLQDDRTRDITYDYIIKHINALGMINYLKSCSISGNVYSGIIILDMLFKLAELLVYSSLSHKSNSSIKEDFKRKILQKVYNSSRNEYLIAGETMLLIGDENIRIVKDNYGKRKECTEKWATCNIDESAHYVNYDIMYKDIVIQRISLVSVDGARAQIPIPDRNLHISSNKYNFACLMEDDIDVLDDYIYKAKLKVNKRFNF